MTDPAARMGLSDEAKRPKEVLGKEINSARYIYEADFRDFEQVHKAGNEEKLVQSMVFCFASRLKM